MNGYYKKIEVMEEEKNGRGIHQRDLDMSLYTVEELLRIYELVYCHEVRTLLRNGDERERIDMILGLAEFGNQIATAPDDEKTQKTAYDYQNYITPVHQRTLAKLEEGVWDYPCECMRSVIDDRVEVLERLLEEVDEEDTERVDALSVVYDRWCGYQYRMRSNP